jgi:small conductance mechanosensitive channel
LLKSVAQAHPQVCEEPPPKAILSEIGEFALKFTLRVWVNTEDMFATRDDLTLAAERALQDAGVRTPVRQADVRLQGPEPAADEVPTERGT